ncbi:MAG: hypothetical protein A2912_01640 [Candidatus Buchananbacteria bacterium RIFCSPLOWO2_01_FULL_40_23b]|uniref:Uncharacterized protein n=1 Tax=Candidatus Buchananbacteria bacterium RIFCSPLOWO2_01_FULL_40_23b TaxID=1797544 RepID=A0A1G1YTC6_9BACT|nr:MAG: hypothetical protein A2912_01640 [Candidatus Buchananbacteria bacterium RIFCSPLOWO2_01_FULL_40_23b]
MIRQPMAMMNFGKMRQMSWDAARAGRVLNSARSRPILTRVNHMPKEMRYREVMLMNLISQNI